MENIELSPSEFVALLNQTLDYAYPAVTIVGELANFRVSRGKWVYFDLVDEEASVKFFGTIYSLPGPLEDGIKVAVSGRPHMHEIYGFSVQVSSIQPVGAGAIKKAADLLAAKLQKEGLFDESRKRSIAYPPEKIGLITSVQSAAYADFIKILSARSGGVEVFVYDVQVQGEKAVSDIVEALKYFNEGAELLDVIVVTRGGGSAEDLSAFNHEHVVRAVAGSRFPSMVAIGHEVDLSLAELAADKRASTPSNAAELLVPDRKEELAHLENKVNWLRQGLLSQLEAGKNWLELRTDYLRDSVGYLLNNQKQKLDSQGKLLSALSPQLALQRGYAIVRGERGVIKSVSDVKSKDKLAINVSDGTIKAVVE